MKEGKEEEEERRGRMGGEGGKVFGRRAEGMKRRREREEIERAEIEAVKLAPSLCLLRRSVTHY